MLLSQGGDVCLVAVIVEPVAHHGVRLAHMLLDLVPGHLEGIDLASDHARKRVGYLGHGHLIPPRSTSRPIQQSGFTDIRPL
jgi:hypothetical protein